MLVGTLVGESAARAADFSDESIVEAACASLRRMLGAGVLPRRIGSRVVRWAEDKAASDPTAITLWTRRIATRSASPSPATAASFSRARPRTLSTKAAYAALLSGERAAAEAVEALADEALADEREADERGRGDGAERSVQ